MRLEDGIHYRAFTQILKCLLVVARKSRVQVFITTHSITLLEDDRTPELGGVVGNSIDKHGQPCGLM